MEDKKIKFSGEKEKFDTGATREKKIGKGLYSCLPPEAIRQLALIYEGGAEIHGTFNYRKGLPLSSFLSSALRHLFQTLEGKTDENHPAHCAWNILEYIEALSRIENGTLPAELDDRWKEPSPGATVPINDDDINSLRIPKPDTYKPGIGTAEDFIGTNTKPSSKIITYTGKSFDVFNPDPADVNIVDIAIALGNQCRYTGHTNRFYSVAEHCVRMSWVSSNKEINMLCLMHDASEAYLTDIPSPIKQHLDQYKQLEKSVMAAIYTAFNIPSVEEVEVEVKSIDRRMLKTEIIYLLPHSDLFDSWYPDSKPFTRDSIIASGIKCDPWSPKKAQDMFLKRAEKLGIYTPDKEKV